MGQQALALLAVLVACFIGPAIGVVFLLNRKRRIQARRKSPLRGEMLRSPGHSLREKLEDATLDSMGDIAVLMVIPPMVLLLIVATRQPWEDIAASLRQSPTVIVVAIAVVAYLVRRMLNRGKEIDNIKVGYDCELAVGQELDQLMRQGAYVFHDVPCDEFNIDHVVVSSHGVFAVETKGRTKDKLGDAKANATVTGKLLHFPSRSTSSPLAQAERQSEWLARHLTSATGSRVHVRPVLALPGWWVEEAGTGPVTVISGKALGKRLLKPGAAQTMSEQDVQRVKHQVEQLCRTVQPRFGRTSTA